MVEPPLHETSSVSPSLRLSQAGRLRVGVDATCWLNGRGYGRYVRSLLRALVRLDRDNHYTFCLDAPVAEGTLPPQAEVRVVKAGAPTAVAASANGHRSLRDMWRMSRALSDPGFDVVLFPTVYSYVPVFTRAKKIVMILDVIAERFPQLTIPNRLNRLFWKAKVALGRRQADAIVTLSDHSRREIVEYFKVRPQGVHVVGAAGDPVFRVLDDPRPTPHLASLGLAGEGRSVVYVGGFNPHKNIGTLVSAFAKVAAQEEFADARLVLVGEYEKEVFHSYYGTIKQQVDALGLTERAVFTGFLPDDELVVLLNRSTLLALPSLLEGFGLPAVEAAACGCPVLATTASPLPALLGEGGLFVNPLDQAGWESGLIQMLRSEELRLRAREAGLAAARRLTWDVAAQQMMGVLRAVGGGTRASNGQDGERE